MKNKKIYIWIFIILAIVAAFLSDDKKTDNRLSKSDAENQAASKNIKKYKDVLQTLYVKYYKKYDNVKCDDTFYKGHAFIKCYSPHAENKNKIGGLYGIDDKDGSIAIYTINGKAMGHRETMLKNDGENLTKFLRSNGVYTFDELPKDGIVDILQWLRIDEIDNLIINDKKYEGDEIGKFIIPKNPEPVKAEYQKPILNDDDKAAVEEESKNAAISFLSVLYKPYKQYINQCLDGNLPSIPVMRESKCSFYEMPDKSYYENLKKSDLLEADLTRENIEALDRNFNDAFQALANEIMSFKAVNPNAFKQIEGRLGIGSAHFDPIKINYATGEVKVYYALSDFRELRNEIEPEYYKTVLYDGVLWLKCAKIDKSIKCKILPIY